jgi:hypothetical protein
MPRFLDRAASATGWRTVQRVITLIPSLSMMFMLMTPAVDAQFAEPPDAFDGGVVPPVRRIVIPSLEVGLSPDRPIPLGDTCSCTIDRTGQVSQFDITVVRVVPDALPMVQQLSRFNPLPIPQHRYVGVYVGQQYIAGPETQAYTASDSDWKATSTMERLRDSQELFHPDREYRPRADAYPGNYINGWLFFELPIDKPAYLVWNYNFVGERGVWFALQ